MTQTNSALDLTGLSKRDVQLLRDVAAEPRRRAAEGRGIPVPARFAQCFAQALVDAAEVIPAVGQRGLAILYDAVATIERYGDRTHALSLLVGTMSMLKDTVAFAWRNPAITVAVVVTGAALGAITGVIVRMIIAYYAG